MSLNLRLSIRLVGVFLAACADGPVDAARTFDEMFPEERRVSFEEDEDDPLTEITSVTPRPDGGFIVVDGPASRVREYDAEGRISRVRGRPGDGPGELRSPEAAVYGPSGELHVVERGSPRHTVFWPGDSVTVSRLDAHYGFSLHAVDDGFVIGLGTPEERFGILSGDGEVVQRFATPAERVNETPFWIFFVQERSAVVGDRIFVNSSFEPTIRVFSLSGDSLDAFGTPPPEWIEPTEPGIDQISGPADRARVTEWARTFTVVTGLAAVDGRLIVQYGRHDPTPNEPDHLDRHRADIYSLDGEKLVADLGLQRRLLAGGDQLYVLEAEPPEPWTISVRTLARSDP